MTRRTLGRPAACLIAVLALLATGTPANGQILRAYAGASLGSFSVHADEVDGRSIAGGLFGGMALSKYVDAEFEIAFPTDTFTRSYTGDQRVVRTSRCFASGDRATRRRHPLRQGARDHGQPLCGRRHSSCDGKTPDAWRHRRRDEPTRDRPIRPLRRSQSRKASTLNTPPSSAAPRSRRATLAARQSARISPSR